MTLEWGLEIMRNKKPLLPPRALEALKYLAKGYNYPQMARKMCISYQTAKNYGYFILERLRAKNKAHAVAKAKDMGII